MPNNQNSISVFAPATVANVAVGFDILGFPLDSVGDVITVSKFEKREVVISSISGTNEIIPLEANKNVSGVVLLELMKSLNLDFGFEISIQKGIPLGSGMGGSAASSVGALVAANQLLKNQLTKNELLQLSLLGEKTASGAAHGDNVTPCLFGGLTLTRSIDPIDVIKIPVPDSIYVVLVHPHFRLDTSLSRSVLRTNLPVSDFVRQSANLAGFISGCYTNDIDLISRSLKDVLIEPKRSPLIPGFDLAKDAAVSNGVLGCSISGSGPSFFAWCNGKESAEKVRDAVVSAFKSEMVESDSWVSKVSEQGAKVIETNEKVSVA